MGILLFPATAAADTNKAAGQRWAVIVGISDYQNLGDLDNAVNDALDMKSVLINNCNFASDHVYMYTNGQATRWGIQNALNLMTTRAGSSDLFVFYFSGHGDQMDRDLSPYDEADGMDEVICPYDSYSDSYDRDISDDDLTTWLGRINSKNTICIFDTCNSGGMVKGSRISAIYGASKDSPAVEAFVWNDGLSEDLTKDARASRYVMLMASDDDESAVDSSRLGNGVFTYYLVEGLTSPSANTDADRYISIEEAFTYAQAASTRYDSDMHPQIYDGDRSNEIEFAALSATPTPTATQSTSAVSITGKTVTGYISSGESQYYYFDIPSGTPVSSCTVTLAGPSGADFDLYVRKSTTPTKDNYDYRGFTATANEQVSISSPSAGRYYVMVQAYSGAGSFTITEMHSAGPTQTPTPTPTVTLTTMPTTRPSPTVTIGTTAVDITGRTVTGYISTGQSKYYYFDVTALQSGRTCTVTLDGPSGADFDLYVRKGSNPTTDTYDYRGYTSSADEQVNIAAATTGRYYVMVKAYSGTGTYTITETSGGSSTGTVTPTPTVTLTTIPTTSPSPTVTPGTSSVDITGRTIQGYISSGQSPYYYFDIPGGSAISSCTVVLDGPSGSDYDLYVRRASNPSTWIYDYRSAGQTADESVTILNPTAGRYYVMVKYYSGPGSYTLRETHSTGTYVTPTPTATATLTIVPTVTLTTMPTTSPSPTVTIGTTAVDITGKTVTGYISTGQSKYYYFDVTALQSGRTCTVTLDGPSGADFDLYVRKGSNPTTDTYDYRGYTSSADEQVNIAAATTGRYYVMVRAYSGSGTYTITETSGGSSTGSVTPTPTVTPGTSSVDITGRTIQGYISSGQSPYYYFDIPVGSAISSCTVVLDGPPGSDYDLYVKRGSNPSTWIYDYRSAGRTADESVTILDPSPGRYYVMVKYYSGPGSYTLRETHSGAVSGTTLPTQTSTPVIPSTILPVTTATTISPTPTTMPAGETGYGFIRVISSPTSAWIYLDGVPARKITPSTLTVATGTHAVECRKTGYSTQVQTVTVVQGMTTDATFVL